MEGHQGQLGLGGGGDYDLYDGRPPHQVESDTSAAAAHNILDSVKGMQLQVYDFISFCGKKGATDVEIQLALSMSVSAQVPRRRELVLKGLVIDSGQRRKNPSGCKAVVWVKTTVPHPPPAKPTSKQEETKALSDVVRDQARRINELEGALNMALDYQIGNRGTEHPYYICSTWPHGKFPAWVTVADVLLKERKR
jgi:hypothetical protein